MKGQFHCLSLDQVCSFCDLIIIQIKTVMIFIILTFMTMGMPMHRLMTQTIKMKISRRHLPRRNTGNVSIHEVTKPSTPTN